MVALAIDPTNFYCIYTCVKIYQHFKRVSDQKLSDERYTRLGKGQRLKHFGADGLLKEEDVYFFRSTADRLDDPAYYNRGRMGKCAIQKVFEFWRQLGREKTKQNLKENKEISAWEAKNALKLGDEPLTTDMARQTCVTLGLKLFKFGSHEVRGVTHHKDGKWFDSYHKAQAWRDEEQDALLSRTFQLNAQGKY